MNQVFVSCLKLRFSIACLTNLMINVLFVLLAITRILTKNASKFPVRIASKLNQEKTVRFVSKDISLIMVYATKKRSVLPKTVSFVSSMLYYKQRIVFFVILIMPIYSEKRSNFAYRNKIQCIIVFTLIHPMRKNAQFAT